MILRKIKEYLKEALIGSTLWTILLTPYGIWKIHLTSSQYIEWVLMEYIIVLPLAPIVYRLTAYFKRKI